jgi:2-iminoacetate synthase
VAFEVSTFLEAFEKTDVAEIRAVLEGCGPESVRDALGREEPGFRDFLSLLSPAAEPFLDDMALLAREKTERHFGRNIALYIPLYISNECRSDCAYCGFNRANAIRRKTLDRAEIRAELEAIREWRFSSVLLLTGDAPRAVPVGRLAEAVEAARALFPQVSLEVYPMDTADYAALVRAGATGLTIYQETYDRRTYDALHASGAKKNFVYRLETPDRAAEAGFRKIGIGALLGLSDWRLEAACLGAHASYLLRNYWRAEVAVSVPRLRRSVAEFQPPAEVSDREMVQMILALRLYMPRVGITLSTRESRQLRDNMIGLGVTSMSAGSRTSPGGYGRGVKAQADEQFAVEDLRSPAEVAAAIRSRGYYPVFKDWSREFGGVSVESHR